MWNVLDIGELKSCHFRGTGWTPGWCGLIQMRGQVCHSLASRWQRCYDMHSLLFLLLFLAAKWNDYAYSCRKRPRHVCSICPFFVLPLILSASADNSRISACPSYMPSTRGKPHPKHLQANSHFASHAFKLVQVTS